MIGEVKEVFELNKTIETILNHRSIRSFTDERLSEEEVLTLIKKCTGCFDIKLCTGVQYYWCDRSKEEGQAC